MPNIAQCKIFKIRTATSYFSHMAVLMSLPSKLHREDVRKDPVFRAQFHTMCANVGVDPLASNKGMWAQLLGFGDFYYELGVQVVEACLATRSMNGGLMDLDSLRASVTVWTSNHAPAFQTHCMTMLHDNYRDGNGDMLTVSVRILDLSCFKAA